jgi:hypothetical protein
MEKAISPAFILREVSIVSDTDMVTWVINSSFFKILFSLLYGKGTRERRGIYEAAAIRKRAVLSGTGPESGVF